MNHLRLVNFLFIRFTRLTRLLEEITLSVVVQLLAISSSLYTDSLFLGGGGLTYFFKSDC